MAFLSHFSRVLNQKILNKIIFTILLMKNHREASVVSHRHLQSVLPRHTRHLTTTSMNPHATAAHPQNVVFHLHMLILSQFQQPKCTRAVVETSENGIAHQVTMSW